MQVYSIGLIIIAKKIENAKKVKKFYKVLKTPKGIENTKRY
jgi:hypothetical protein